MSKLAIGKKKEIAEQLFINEGYNAKTISGMIDVTEQTISKWRTQGKWDERRTKLLAAPHRIKEVILKEMEKISTGVKSTIDADALSKLAKTLTTIDAKLSLPMIISVFKEFDNWMADQNPSLAVEFLQYHKRFLLTREDDGQ